MTLIMFLVWNLLNFIISKLKKKTAQLRRLNLKLQNGQHSASEKLTTTFAHELV